MMILAVTPTEDDRALARGVHARFAAQVGSEHIASAVSLTYIAAITRQYPIKSVVEFGSGIGTITSVLLARLPRETRIVCTEHKEWCRQQFERNIPASERSRIEMIPAKRPTVTEPFDFVIIDGPVSANSAFVREGSIIFVEGTRTGTWEPVRQDLEGRGLACQFTQQSERRVFFRMRRLLGVPLLPRFKVKAKTCSMGVVASASEVRSSPPAATASAAG